MGQEWERNGSGLLYDNNMIKSKQHYFTLIQNKLLLNTVKPTWHSGSSPVTRDTGSITCFLRDEMPRFPSIPIVDEPRFPEIFDKPHQPHFPMSRQH